MLRSARKELLQGTWTLQATTGAMGTAPFHAGQKHQAEEGSHCTVLSISN